MDINGSVNAGELEFTVELDTDDVWREIEDTVTEAAYEVGREAARAEIHNGDFNVDYAQGAEDLLNSYTPGTGCSLARQFERGVQGAIGVNDFLAEAIKEAATTLGTSAEIGTAEVRTLVREEIRLALTAIIGQLTKEPTPGA